MRSTITFAILGMASFTAVVMSGAFSANARPHRSGEHHAQSRAAGTPRLAVIALASQRVSIYGDSGKILEAPVSTGATGHETPAGIYSIMQKEEEHHSNLYDEAPMPYMERLTWTGIAMHAGPLPGYAASHGCVRLSYNFAEQLYRLTQPGLRVVIVREDIAPVEFEQPAMFTRLHSSEEGITSQPTEAQTRARLQSIAEKKLAEAQAAEKRESQARSAAAIKASEAEHALVALEAAKARLAQAEAQSAASGYVQETADSSGRKERGETPNIQAAANIEAARAQLEAAKTEAQARMDAAALAWEKAKDATAAANRAADAAEMAKQNTSPVSVFISRKLQRLYIRKGKAPVFESPVIIENPGKPIGTFVFTALNYTAEPGRMRWNAVSMYKNATNIEPYSEAHRASRKNRSTKPADVAGAQAALDRLAVPQEALDRVSEVLLPGSALIVSDEGLSNETGKDTDFIVFMSGEPQGGSTPPGKLIALTDARSGRESAHRQRRRTHSSASRSRSYARGEMRQGWRSTSFPPFFSF
jgi:hypothetical protein